jgi:hypothetical protein
LSDDIPVEESFRVLSWTTNLSAHVSFMIGDVINYGEMRWGRDKYKAALNKTGLSYSRLAHCASVALRIPFEQRRAALSFEHHREILRIGVDAKIEELLKKVAAKADKGEAPTVKELRLEVSKLKPPKTKKPGKPTSGKGKKGNKSKPEAPYEPTDEEREKLDATEDALVTVNQDINSSGVVDIICKLDTKEKKRWLHTILEPLVNVYNKIDRCTGY